MTVAQFSALFATMFAIAIVPGPSDLLVVGRAIAAGFAHGAAVTIGIVVADYVFILAALLALEFLATELNALFRVVQYAGGLYLIALGYSIWRGRRRITGVAEQRAPSLAASLSAGLLTTLADPKAILFYLGFLPAFIDLATVTWRDAALVMAAATFTIMSIKLSYAFVAARAKVWLEDHRTRVLTSAVGATASIAVGVYLLVSD